MLVPSQDDLSAENVALILDIIRASGFRTVHYTGRADESLLRGLLGVQPSLEVSVMDMPDRWGTGYAFHYDESDFGNNLPRDRPDWLEGIPFYQEGSSEHEIAIYDWPWNSFDQLDQIVKFTGRQPAKLIILFGDGLVNEVGVEGMSETGEWERKTILRPMPFKHPKYDWEQIEDIWIGRWREGVISSYERAQRRRVRKQNQSDSNSNPY